jgi:hypothetical protein
MIFLAAALSALHAARFADAATLCYRIPKHATGKELNGSEA